MGFDFTDHCRLSRGTDADADADVGADASANDDASADDRANLRADARADDDAGADDHAGADRHRWGRRGECMLIKWRRLRVVLRRLPACDQGRRIR